MEQANTKHIKNSALIGMILGDGSIGKRSGLYLRHGGKQLDYVNEKVNYLGKYLKPTFIKDNIDKKGFGYRYAYFKRKNVKYLNRLLYDQNHRKRFTLKIANRFNEISLAFFYMDDGSLVLHKKRNRNCFASREIYLATNWMNEEEVELFIEMLKRKFGLIFKKSREKRGWRIRCNTENTIKFLRLVFPIVNMFSTLKYKLDLKYKNKVINLNNITSQN